MSKKNQNNYTDDFRRQIVAMYKGGKSAKSIHEEYGVTKTSVYEWVRKANNSGSFRDRDNRSAGENELIELRRENKRLLMENDILKQAALIMARK